MNWDIVTWGLVAISLSGNIFIIKKNVIGQWMWAFANIGWVAFNLTLGAYAQAFLFAVYFGMCVWGIIAWNKKSPTETIEQTA